MSTHSAPSNNMQLWQTAMPVGDARFHFAAPALVKRWRELSAHSMFSDMPASGGNNLAIMAYLKDEIGASAKVNTEKFEIERQINQNFIDMIRARKLICFAFEPPRTMASEPVEIPAAHWSVFPNWQTGEFIANGLKLIELRVVLRETVQQTITPPKQATPGRPTIRKDIEAAFAALDESGHIDTNNSAKAHFPMIRDWLNHSRKEANQEELSLSDEGIRMHFSPLFKALRENRKQ